MKIARENTREFIKSESKLGIIAVVFTKKDGTERTMTLRTGVKKNLRGGSNKVEALDRSYMTVYDMNKGGYRTLNLRTLKNISARGKKYLVV